MNCNGCGKACPDTAVCEDAKCVCPGTEIVCGDQCVDTDTDQDNCGGCGLPCIGGACTGGVCVCPEGKTNCHGTCADLDTDKQHCGSCNVACSDAEICGLPPDVVGAAGAGGGGSGGEGVHECVCPPEREDCSGVCADLTSDMNHCGDCDTACPGDKICSASACVCTPGTEDCGGGVCANLSSDKDHCGDCDTACPSNQICKNKNCGCPAGSSLCGDTCVDLQNDRNNCNSCGKACGGDQVCSGGQCLRSPCDQLCGSTEAMPLVEDGFRLDPLGTGAHCLEVKGYDPVDTNRRIVCWNFQNGRSLRVNGTSVACLTGAGVALGEPRAGGFCVQVGAGLASYAGLLLPTK